MCPIWEWFKKIFSFTHDLPSVLSRYTRSSKRPSGLPAWGSLKLSQRLLRTPWSSWSCGCSLLALTFIFIMYGCSLSHSSWDTVLSPSSFHKQSTRTKHLKTLRRDSEVIRVHLWNPWVPLFQLPFQFHSIVLSRTTLGESSSAGSSHMKKFSSL